MRRIVDLSYDLYPSDKARKLQITMINPHKFNPDVNCLEDQWYIAHEVFMTSHIGTHIETPYHINPKGKDCATLELEKLCGDAVLLDMKGYSDDFPLQPEHVEKAIQAAGGIKEGDMVLVNLGYCQYFGTPKYDHPPYFTNEAIEYLIGKGMKFMGVDANGAEVPHDDNHPNHHSLLDRGIPLIENVANLDNLRTRRFQLYSFPVAVHGLESLPIRLVAIEETED